SGERDAFVYALNVAGGAGQLALDGAADADRLVVLGNLVVLGGVRVEVVFAVPFADRRDLAAEQQAGLDDGVDGGLVHHGKDAGQREHDGIGERVLRLPVAGGHAGEHFGVGLDLDVNLKTDDGFVLHLGKGESFGEVGLGHRGHRARTQRSQSQAGETVFGEQGGGKVKKQANATGAEAEICQDLGFVHIEQCIHGLEFDDNLPSHEKIESIGILDKQVFVTNGAQLLFLEF